MITKNELSILETVLLLLSGTKEMRILELDLAPYLRKAKEIIKIIKS